MPAHEDLKLLLSAAKDAGEIARRYWKNDPRVWEKPENAGPVTEADLAVNDFLIERLLGHRPDYGWLSEESTDSPARLNAEYCFIIDPIDGTRAFIDGQSGFSHSFAVAKEGKIIAAVVHLPVLGLTYTAIEDGPALLNGTQLTVNDGLLPGANVLTNKSFLTPKFWKNGVVPNIKHSFRPSLAWRLCLVAEGRFDAVLTLRMTWEWDIAAGSLIAERAGASVTDMCKQTLGFNNPEPQIKGLVIAGPKLHSAITDRLNP